MLIEGLKTMHNQSELIKASLQKMQEKAQKLHEGLLMQWYELGFEAGNESKKKEFDENQNKKRIEGLKKRQEILRHENNEKALEWWIKECQQESITFDEILEGWGAFEKIMLVVEDQEKERKQTIKKWIQCMGDEGIRRVWSTCGMKSGIEWMKHSNWSQAWLEAMVNWEVENKAKDWEEMNLDLLKKIQSMTYGLSKDKYESLVNIGIKIWARSIEDWMQRKSIKDSLKVKLKIEEILALNEFHWNYIEPIIDRVDWGIWNARWRSECEKRIQCGKINEKIMAWYEKKMLFKSINDPKNQENSKSERVQELQEKKTKRI